MIIDEFIKLLFLYEDQLIHWFEFSTIVYLILTRNRYNEMVEDSYKDTIQTLKQLTTNNFKDLLENSEKISIQSFKNWDDETKETIAKIEKQLYDLDISTRVIKNQLEEEIIRKNKKLEENEETIFNLNMTITRKSTQLEKLKAKGK